MKISEKYKSLFTVVITMIAVNLIFQRRGFNELLFELVIFTFTYLIFFPLLESLAVFMTNSKKDDLHN